MRATFKSFGLIAPLAFVVIVASLSRADDAKKPPSPEAFLKAMAEAGQPGAEHKKLEPLVGNWNFTLKMWTDPSQSPAELKGAVERKWIMGGRFVQETVKGECDGKPFEGLGLIGYSSAQKKFTVVRACGLCGMVSSGLATCDAAGGKFLCTTEDCCPVTGEKIKGRDEIIIESSDKIVTNVYKTVGGKEAKMVEIVSTRQK
jgi:hypothetical protein